MDAPAPGLLLVPYDIAANCFPHLRGLARPGTCGAALLGLDAVFRLVAEGLDARLQGAFWHRLVLAAGLQPRLRATSMMGV